MTVSVAAVADGDRPVGQAIVVPAADGRRRLEGLLRALATVKAFEVPVMTPDASVAVSVVDAAL